MSISLDQLKEAVSIKEQIAKLELKLNQILGGKPSPSAAPAAAEKKGPSKMTPEAKAKISAAAKARWAKIKAAKPAAKPVAKSAPKKAKRVLSAQGKANIIAAAKKRWAAKRARG